MVKQRENGGTECGVWRVGSVVTIEDTIVYVEVGVFGILRGDY